MPPMSPLSLAATAFKLNSSKCICFFSLHEHLPRLLPPLIAELRLLSLTVYSPLLVDGKHWSKWKMCLNVADI